MHFYHQRCLESKYVPVLLHTAGRKLIPPEELEVASLRAPLAMLSLARMDLVIMGKLLSAGPKAAGWRQPGVGHGSIISTPH